MVTSVEHVIWCDLCKVHGKLGTVRVSDRMDDNIDFIK